MSNIGHTLTDRRTEFNIYKPGAYRLDIAWLFTRPNRPFQRLQFALNGLPLQQISVEKPCTVELFVPETGSLVITLPDASRPIDVGLGPDTRMLSIGIAAFNAIPEFYVFPGFRLGERKSDVMLEDAGLSRVEVAQGVESLGDNGELGMVQRELGWDPISLFRFSSTSPEALLRALEGRLSGLGTPGTLSLSPLGEHRGYMVADSTYGLLYRTRTLESGISAEEILTREHARLPFLGRKFIEEATLAERTFVYRDHGQLSEQLAGRILSALRIFGPNRLLVVRDADAAHPPETLHPARHDVSYAWIDYKGPDWWMITDTWVETLLKARRLPKLT